MHPSPSLVISVLTKLFPEVEVDDDQLVSFAVETDTGVWECLGGPAGDLPVLLFQGCSPTTVPADRIARVTELVNRANRSCVLATFEIDVDDGSVFCSTAIDLEPLAGLDDRAMAVSLGAAIAGRHIDEVFAAMTRYQPALVVVTHGDTSAREAIDSVERSLQS